jgi:hypothetical protein
VVTCAFDAAWFKVAVVFGVPVSLAVCTLGNVSFVSRQFKFYFALLYVFDIEYIFAIRGRLRFDEHGEWEFGSVLLNVPNICNRMSKFFNFHFDVFQVNGVVHIF